MPISADQMVAANNYTAFEICCSVGDSVEIIRQDYGWAWCKTENDEDGWIPLRKLCDDMSQFIGTNDWFEHSKAIRWQLK